jgi:hypothetical protein
MKPETEGRVSAALNAWATQIDTLTNPMPDLLPVESSPRRHRAPLRWGVPLLAAASVIAVVTASLALVSHESALPATPATSPPSTPVSMAPTSSPTTPTPTSPTPTTTTHRIPPPPDPRAVDFANATIDIPDWPTVGATGAPDCPAGARHFSNGQSKVGRWASTLNPHIAYGNLDGLPGEEAVLSVGCNNAEGTPTLLFAVKVARDGSLTTLGGAINVAQSGLLVILPDSVTVDGSLVTVSVTGPYIGPGHPAQGSQVRAYRLQGDAFVQVSGPTSFGSWDIDGDGRVDTARLTYLGGSGPNNWKLVVEMTSLGRQTIPFMGSPAGTTASPAIVGSVDADEDGYAEIFVKVDAGASTAFWTIFRLTDGHLLQVTTNGQPLRLAIGGTVTHTAGFECSGAQFVTIGESVTPPDYKTWNYERDTYTWNGAVLVLASKQTGQAASAIDSTVKCGDLSR